MQLQGHSAAFSSSIAGDGSDLFIHGNRLRTTHPSKRVPLGEKEWPGGPPGDADDDEDADDEDDTDLDAAAHLTREPGGQNGGLVEEPGGQSREKCQSPGGSPSDAAA